MGMDWIRYDRYGCTITNAGHGVLREMTLECLRMKDQDSSCRCQSGSCVGEVF